MFYQNTIMLKKKKKGIAKKLLNPNGTEVEVVNMSQYLLT